MLVAPTDDRLRAPDWRDKYRWPDPDQGWSGPLAGYPPDHPIRAGRPIPLHLIARKYQQDEEVTRYQALGLIGSHIPAGTPAWTAPAGGDTPPSGDPPLINTPAEKARKLAMADALGIRRASSLLAPGANVEANAPSVSADVSKADRKVYMRDLMRRKRAAEKAKLLSGGAHVLGIGSHKSGRDS
jgi:hypothetical protein